MSMLLKESELWQEILTISANFLKGLTESYFRHELLWIPPSVDTEVYDMVDWKKDASIYEDFSD